MTGARGATDFTGSGEAYDRFMGRYSRLLGPPFADFCAVQAGQRLLDVGCGPGAFTTVAVDRVGAASVTAVDPSPSFVVACRRRHPGVEVLTGVAESLPLEDAVFDRAVAQLVLHFATDPHRAVAEMSRVVRPGGLVGACVWHGTEEMGLLHVVSRARAVVEPPSAPPAPRPFGDEGQLAALLSGAGLVDVEEVTIAVTGHYTGFEELWNTLLGGVGPAGAYVVSLTAEDRERYREALHEAVGRPPREFSLSATARAARGVHPG